MVFGVCAALGRTTDVDPVIYRVLFVVLTIFGGLGVLIYALGWLFIPDESSGVSEAERLLHRRRHWHRPRLLALIVSIAVVIWLTSVVHGGHNLAVSIVVIALLGYLVLRDRGAVATVPHAEAPTEPLGDAPAPDAPGSWWAATQHPTPPEPPRAPLPPRTPGSRLGWITLSVALVVAGALIAAREAGVHHLSVTNILAATVIVIGCGLLVGSVVGRARWLVLPGGALAVALLALTGIGVPIDGGIGDRTWHPTNVVARSYHLGIGHAVLDLRDVPLDTSGPTYIDASVALGELKVLVPDRVTVWQVEGRAAVGRVEVFGTEHDGVHPRVFADSGQLVTANGPGNPLILRLRVGAGYVEVSHVAG
jgi:phage shock protein PspC (stress-responsive transcriptional regulator)